MENPLVGKFFIIPNSPEHGPHGKVQIVSHLHDEYYFVVNFDLCSGFSDYYCVLHLGDLRSLPLFESEEALEEFFSQAEEHGEEPNSTKEISH